MVRTDEAKKRAAAKEGTLVVYASLRGVLQDAVKAFRNKYEDLNLHVSYFSSHPVPIYEKVKAEVKNGIPTADVVIMPQYMLMMMAREGLLKSYESPEIRVFPKHVYDSKNHMWAAMAVEPTSVVYNNTKIKQQELPTTLDGLTDGKWIGKTALQSVTSFPEGKMAFYYLVALKRHLGERKWETFLKDFLKTKPVSYECLLYMTHMLGLGQHIFGFPATLRKQGMGDDFARLREGGVQPVPLADVPPAAICRTAGIVKKGPHQGAAELFFDFIMSAQWQAEMGRNLDGMVPARPGIVATYWVSQPLANGWLHYPNTEEVDREEEYLQVFRNLGFAKLAKGIG
jgi:ABC-type Fe3+ transport system substrate-binding protein